MPAPSSRRLRIAARTGPCRPLTLAKYVDRCEHILLAAWRRGGVASRRAARHVDCAPPAQHLWAQPADAACTWRPPSGACNRPNCSARVRDPRIGLAARPDSVRPSALDRSHTICEHSSSNGLRTTFPHCRTSGLLAWRASGGCVVRRQPVGLRSASASTVPEISGSRTYARPNSPTSERPRPPSAGISPFPG